MLFSATLNAAVFQYSMPVAMPKGESAAFLWIPPQAKQVRGVVMAGLTLMEREFAKDPVIRQACAAENLALVFLKCGLASVDVPKVLEDLAGASGYGELAWAPLLFVGHSAGGPQAKDCAIRFADRCFGLVQYRGGVPGGSNTVPPGIPTLMMIGQFDEFGGTMRNEAGRETWQGGGEAMAQFRARNERNLGSIVVEPGAGHFAWSDRNAAYLALFLRKAAQARLPAGEAPGQRLRVIDPRGGWLTSLDITALNTPKPGAYHQYQGSRTNAAWHFDCDLALATVAYHAGGFGKQDQFVRWQDPYNVDAGARFFFSRIQWVGDGQTFEVHPVYADAYPAQYNGQGPRWLQAGQAVGHSAAPILVRPVSGPLIAAGTNTFRLQYDGLAPATEGARVTFLAFSAGDASHRYTEQVGMMPRGFSGLKTGKPQTITFAPIGNLKPGSAPVRLTATSDAALPVEFYVAHGPAIVTNGLLRIADLPLRAQFPIALKVVAWQFGSGIEPLVQTAHPVEQTIHIESETPNP